MSPPFPARGETNTSDSMDTAEEPNAEHQLLQQRWCSGSLLPPHPLGCGLALRRPNGRVLLWPAEFRDRHLVPACLAEGYTEQS